MKEFLQYIWSILTFSVNTNTIKVSKVKPKIAKKVAKKTTTKTKK